jgi:N-acetylmuramoyl-L-alanine amidase
VKIVPQDSPNQDDRAGPIDVIILHYTGMQSARAAIDRLRDPAARVSSHYVVDEDGTIYALVPEPRRAWHAGVSFWRGRRGLNDFSIGIEIVNPGHEWGYRPFPPAQIESVTALCRDILTRHEIPARNIIGHSDVAPNRKQDPGELFPWEALAAAGVGLWPGGTDAGIGPCAWNADRVRTGLATVGYDVGDVSEAGLATLLVAFQRHWRPEAVTGEADAGTVGRLERLLALLAS